MHVTLPVHVRMFTSCAPLPRPCLGSVVYMLALHPPPMCGLLSTAPRRPPLAANQPERGAIWQSAAWLWPAAHLVTPGSTFEAGAAPKKPHISFILSAVRNDSFARLYCGCWRKPSTAVSLHPPPPTPPFSSYLCWLVLITVYWKTPPR